MFIAGEGFIAGSNGQVFRSSVLQNFTTWQALPTLPISIQLNGISTYDGNILYVVGEEGNAFMTTNQGLDWIKLKLDTFATLYCVSQASNNDIIIAGDFGFSAISNDAGSKWTNTTIFNVTYIPSPLPPHNLHMVSSAVIFAGSNSNGDIAVTVNSGRMWQLVQIPSSDMFDSLIYSLSMYSSDVGIAGMLF